MSSLNELQFQKISKYSLRVKKSILKQNEKKITEYYNHLKYNIQLGGNIKEIEDKFLNLDKIINDISSSKGYQTYDNLFQDLNKCNKDKDDLEKKITELNSKLEGTISEIPKVSNIDTSKDEQITKLNEDIESLNKKIESLQELLIKSQSNEEEKDRTINEVNTVLKRIYEHSNIIGNDINTQALELNKKIDKYNKVIDIINDKIITFKDDINVEESTKFNEAIEVLKKKLSDVITKNSTLDKIKAENNIVNQKVISQENIIKQINGLKQNYSLKKDEIIKLKEIISKLEEEKKSNDDKLNIISNEFGIKLKDLLMKIYGNGDLVDDIMDGTNFGDGKYKIKKD